MSRNSSVTVGVFESETEAQAVAGLLRSHGIPSHLAHDRLGAAIPIRGGATGIRLRVPAEHQAQALELLGAEIADSDESPGATEVSQTRDQRWSDGARSERPTAGTKRISLLQWAVGAVVLGLVALNAVAYMHARAMTDLTGDGTRTSRPEELSGLGKLRVLLTGVNLPRPENKVVPVETGLDYTTHRYDNGRGDTLEAWHVPADASEFLFLLFHSYGSGKSSLIPIAKELHQLGHASLMVDFYGSGGSSGHGTSMGFLEAGDVTATLSFARSRWPDVAIVLYGQSMGGAAALRSIAVDGTSPDGLVLEGTFDNMLNTTKNRFRAMGLPATPLAHLLVFWGGQRNGHNAFSHNPAEYARSVTCPTLVLHGSRDARVSIDEAQAIHGGLQGERWFAEFPSAGHQSLLRADPERWHRGLARLLNHLRRSRNGSVPG